MTVDQLRQWGEHANPADERKGVVKPAAELCKADGLLGKFGMGSKVSGFTMGASVRAVTHHKDMNGIVCEMVLSTDAFEKKKNDGGDWTQGEIKTRPVYNKQKAKTKELFESFRSDKEKECSYVPYAMQAAEEKHRPFSLFMVSQIHESVHEALKYEITDTDGVPGRGGHESLQDMMRDLRDMYFVYTDGMKHEINDEPNDLPHEAMHYRHGPLDIQFKVVKQRSQHEWDVVLHHSLRYDSDAQRPGFSEVTVNGTPHPELPLALPPPNLDRVDDTTLAPVRIAVDRMRLLFHLCAPDLFRFRLHRFGMQ